MRPARLLAAPLVLALALTATACSGDDAGDGDSGDGGSKASPAEVLAAAKKALDETTGVPVVVDPSSAQLLTGATLDYKDGLQGAGFAIDNPNAQKTCGCGQSFS